MGCVAKTLKPSVDYVQLHFANPVLHMMPKMPNYKVCYPRVALLEKPYHHCSQLLLKLPLILVCTSIHVQDNSLSRE